MRAAADPAAPRPAHRGPCAAAPSPASRQQAGGRAGPPSGARAARQRPSYQQLHGLVATDGHAGADLLVTTDAEGAHGVPGLAIHWLLAGQLLQHLQAHPGRATVHLPCPPLPGLQRARGAISAAAPHLGCLLQAIAGLASADVEHQLRHADFPHGVGRLLVALRGGQRSPVSCPATCPAPGPALLPCERRGARPARSRKTSRPRPARLHALTTMAPDFSLAKEETW
jgi:hypothetical protein